MGVADTLANKPAGQSGHDAAAAAEYFPTAQSVQLPDDAPADFPATQFVHELAPAAE
jgi:hypothetical protein